MKKELSNIEKLKAKLQAQMQAASEDKASTQTNAAVEEIRKAQAGRGRGEVLFPANNNLAQGQRGGQKNKSNDADSKERQARRAKLNLRFSNLVQQQKQERSPSKKADELFGTAGYKERVQQNRANIRSIFEQVHKQTKVNVAKLLNVKRSSIEKPKSMASIMVGNNDNNNNEEKKAQTFISTSNMFVSSNGQQATDIQVKYNEQQATFADVFDFNYLRKAAIAQLPKNTKIEEGHISEKLEAFMRVALCIDDHSFIAFRAQRETYDTKLTAVHTAGGNEKQKLKAEFEQFSTKFQRQFHQLTPKIVDAISHICGLMAFLDSNPEAGVAVHKALQNEYKAEGRSELVQMKKVLVEHCSAKVCQRLELNNDDQENLADKIQSVLLNDALALHAKERVNKLMGLN